MEARQPAASFDSGCMVDRKTSDYARPDGSCIAGWVRRAPARRRTARLADL
jgi:hypothetical protein